MADHAWDGNFTRGSSIPIDMKSWGLELDQLSSYISNPPGWTASKTANFSGSNPTHWIPSCKVFDDTIFEAKYYRQAQSRRIDLVLAKRQAEQVKKMSTIANSHIRWTPNAERNLHSANWRSPLDDSAQAALKRFSSIVPSAFPRWCSVS